jgi:tetratricopeptide (TPR) repeat protein
MKKIFMTLLVLCSPVLAVSACAVEAGEPEQSMALLVDKNNDPTGKARYVLIQNYYIKGNVEYALRAAEKLTILEPLDGKAFEMLGFVQLTSGRVDAAILSLKKALSLGDEESVISLAMALLQQGKPINDYLQKLQKLRSVNVDAYRPLLIYAIGIDSVDDRRSYADKLLNGADLTKFLGKKDILGLLDKLYESLDDRLAIERLKILREGGGGPVGGS